MDRNENKILKSTLTQNIQVINQNDKPTFDRKTPATYSDINLTAVELSVSNIYGIKKYKEMGHIRRRWL